jgi:5-dehydro-4-deoxyglucarate dehydratase
MAQPNIELEALLAFPLTPFTEDLELNLDAFGETVEGHVAAGAGALFIACGTGEFSALAADEDAALLRRAREVANGRVPVWVGAGGGAAMAAPGSRRRRRGAPTASSCSRRISCPGRRPASSTMCVTR